MIVRIRFGRGRPVTRRKGKNGKAALLLSSVLTLVAISFGVFGLWRLCEDLGFAGDFVFADGLLSHFQVWLAASAATQYCSRRLKRYSELAAGEAAIAEPAEPAVQLSRENSRQDSREDRAADSGDDKIGVRI